MQCIETIVDECKFLLGWRPLFLIEPTVQRVDPLLDCCQLIVGLRTPLMGLSHEGIYSLRHGGKLIVIVLPRVIEMFAPARVSRLAMRPLLGFRAMVALTRI